MYCDDVMNPLSRHQPRCVYLGTSLGNIIIALIVTVVVAVHSTKYHLQRGPRPQFQRGQKNITVREGAAAVLPCSVKHLGTKKVAWRRIEEDRFLTIGKMTWVEDNHISLEYSRIDQVSNWNLVIKHVSPEDQGIYECQITSRVGHVRHVQLNVVGPPISHPADSSLLSRVSSTHSVPDNIPEMPVIVCGVADETGCLISITGRKFVDLGDKIELKCNASSGARVADEMDWFKAGDKIDSSKYSHVFIEKYKEIETHSFVSILTIHHSRLQDTGDYICRSSRNDIASLKVTVLHAETEPKRRGTENGRTQGSSYRVDGDGTDSSNNLSPSVNTVLCLLFVWFAVLRWTGRISPHMLLS